MANTQGKELTRSEREEVLRRFHFSRIIVPIIIGLSAVAYLFFQHFDPDEFAKIDWSGITVFWLGMALVFLLLRILLYAWRLKILSDHSLTWARCIQLIFIWEFSSTVSPTNVGGSAVALFVISQEKIGAAKTATIVIYTIVLDTLFFLLCIPLWVLIFGQKIIGPGRLDFQGYGGWELTLITAYVIMLLYGAFFSYGLFYRPDALRKLCLWISRIGFLRRYKRKFERLGEDITITSRALYRKPLIYHLKVFATTVSAWSCRFLLIICLIIGLTRSIPMYFTSVLEVFARIQTMFVIMAVSPVPGAAGVAEILFGNILSDYVPAGIALVVATIWRGMAYYFFLLMGVIIIPQWLSRVLRERKERKLNQAE